MTFLLIERVVLESLNENKCTLEEISEQSGLKKEIVEKIVIGLLKNDVLIQEGQYYFISLKKFEELAKDSNIKENLKYEISDLLNCACHVHFANEKNSSNLKLKKLHLSNSELKYFNAMWANTEEYLERLAKDTRAMKPKDKTVVYWGWSGYENLIDQYLMK